MQRHRGRRIGRQDHGLDGQRLARLTIVRTVGTTTRAGPS